MGPAGDYRGKVRSLADDIRARSDAELRRLLLLRPDLARPAPADLTSLAARAGTRASVLRAVDHLDTAHLRVLEAAVAAGSPVEHAAVGRLAGAEGWERGEAGVEADPDGALVAALLEDLYAAGLLWHGADGRHLVRTVTEVLGPGLAGLAPPTADLAPGTRPLAADRARELAGQAPEAARAVLDRLRWGPGVGTRPADPSSPTGQAVAWLVERRLLVPVEQGRVALPREVGLALRDGRLHREPGLREPASAGTARDPADVDRAAGAQVSDLLLFVDELAAAWGPAPPRVLRAGGLAVRDLGALATALDVDERRAAFVAEVAWTAGIVDDDGGLEPVWAPTAAYDDWQQRPGAARWADLARGWLLSTRAPHLVGSARSRAARGGQTVNALGPDAQWPPVRSLRRDVLDLLADDGEGCASDPASVVARLRFRRPRRLPEDLEDVVGAVLTEAEWLGVTGRGALSSAGRLLLRGPAAEVATDDLATAMHPHLPAPVERVLLQADLTAVAPGPLVGGLAQFLRLVADVESRGGATVYRFSPTSVRRCLDAGWTAEQVLETLADASDTPVPQPLDYLVRDVARRHGQTRVGSVSSYVRSDDEAGLDALLASRGLGHLQLRRIAPTVLVSPVAATTVLEELRERGLSPVIESAGGGVVVPEARERRAAGRRRPADATVRPVDEAAIEALIASLRSGEESARHERERRAARPGPDLPSTDPTTTVALLREAAADRQGVWLGYTDGTGQVDRVLFYPDRVDGGRVHGTSDGAARTLSVHRVTGVAPG